MLTYVVYKNIAVLKTQTNEAAEDGKLRIRFVSDSATEVKSVSLRHEGRGEVLTREPITTEEGTVVADIPIEKDGTYTIEINTFEANEASYIDHLIHAQSILISRTPSGKLLCGPLIATNSPMLWSSMGTIMEMLIAHIDEHRNGYEVV